MSRVAWVLFFLSNEVLAHPGHGAPDAHFHESPVVLLLATAVLAAAIWRLIPVLAEVARRKLPAGNYRLPRR